MQGGFTVDWGLLLATLALLVSGLATFCARWSAAEAKKANDIGRLNALLALRTHYLWLRCCVIRRMAFKQRKTHMQGWMPNHER